MHIDTVCVLGGSGFVGSHLVAALDSAGKQVTVLTRHTERAKHLLVLPHVKILATNVHEPQALHRAFADVDAVINLVGILNEDRNKAGGNFRDAHVELSKSVVAACTAQGVKRLLQMSALNADAGRGSLYFRSKGEAENHVHTFARGKLAVTSFRPSVIFGPGDSLFNRFAQLLRFLPIFPLACPNARFAPVYVGDVVNAFVSALEDKQTFGKHIDLVGPEIFTLKEIVEQTARFMGKRRWIIGLPERLSKLQAVIGECLPGKPFSRDNYASLQIDSISKTAKPQTTGIHAVVPLYLKPAGSLIGGNYASKSKFSPR